MSNFANVLKSYQKCQRGKKKSLDCTRFEYRLGHEINQLTKELKNKTYLPKKGKYFWVTDPKNPEIWASHFRDRVIHHMIIDPLEHIQEKKFISITYACCKNKGPYQALKNLQKQIKKISQGE